MRKQSLLFLLLIVNALLLPAGCIPVLFAINMVNPMSAAFVTDIHVTNALPAPITVTPVGTIGAEGAKSTLPMIALRFPVVMTSRVGGFMIQPGQTRELLYDCDDINFSELVIELQDGTLRQLVIDREPTKNQYHAPAVKQFTVSNPSLLEDVPADVRSAAARTQQRALQWWRIVPLILPWFTFSVVLRMYRRERASTAWAGNRADQPESLS